MSTTLSGTGNPVLAASWNNGLPNANTPGVITGASVFPGTVDGTFSYQNLSFTGTGKITNVGSGTLTLNGGPITVNKTGTTGTLIHAGMGTFAFTQKPTITLTAGRLWQGLGWIAGRPNYIVNGGSLFNQSIQTFIRGYHGDIALNGTSANGGKCDADGNWWMSVGNITNTNAAGPAGSVIIQAGFIQVRGNIQSISENTALLSIGNGNGDSASYSVIGKVTGSDVAFALFVQTNGWGALHGAQAPPGADVSISDAGYGFFIRSQVDQTYANENSLPNWKLRRRTG